MPGSPSCQVLPLFSAGSLLSTDMAENSHHPLPPLQPWWLNPSHGAAGALQSPSSPSWPRRAHGRS